MLRINLKRLGNAGLAAGSGEGGIELWIISVFFLLGIVAGSFVGVYSTIGRTSSFVEGYFANTGEYTGFLIQLWNSSKFHLLALLFGSSLLGVVCIPALSVLRGYLLSFTSAAVISGFGAKGLLIACVSLGLPCLFTIPCFFVLSKDSLAVSRILIAVSAGAPRNVFAPPIFRHIFVCAFFLVAAVLTEIFLVPILIQKILS